jgi:hypothetical protein
MSEVIGEEKSSGIVYSLYKGAIVFFRAAIVCKFLGKLVNR